MERETKKYATVSPRWGRLIAVVVAASMVGAACGSSTNEAEFGATLDEWAQSSDAAKALKSSRQPSSEYDKVEWEDLLPAGYSSDDIFARYEEQLDALEDGSPEAQDIYAEMQAEYAEKAGDVNLELAGSKVNLAGFVAPLSYDDDLITEFLLVPYFRSCIHVPAPPPNQTVLVTVDKANGLTFDESWGAVWVTGTLTVDPVTTDLATASYTMTDATSGVYDDF